MEIYFQNIFPVEKLSIKTSMGEVRPIVMENENLNKSIRQKDSF